jgi:hypothetical protein
MAALIISIISAIFSALAAVAAWIAAQANKRMADATQRQAGIEASRRQDELDALLDSRQNHGRAAITISLRMRDKDGLGGIMKGPQLLVGNSGPAAATGVKILAARYEGGQAIALSSSEIGDLERGDEAVCEIVVPTSIPRPVIVEYEWTDNLGRHTAQRRVLPAETT